MTLLNRYIRQILIESSRVTSLLSSDRYGIIFSGNSPTPPADGNNKVILIFDTNTFFHFWDPEIDPEEDDIWDTFEMALYDSASAMVAFRRSGQTVAGPRHKGEQVTGPCYNGFEIQRIASRERGFSWPLRSIVLDIASQEGTGFFADRESVSDVAKAGYEKRMGGYKRKKFDNELNPQTPDPNDDCVLYSDIDPSAEALDYLYFQSSGTPEYLDTLKANTEVFISNVLKSTPPKIKKAFGFNKNSINKWLYGYGGSGVAYDLFGDMYDIGE